MASLPKWWKIMILADCIALAARCRVWTYWKQFVEFHSFITRWKFSTRDNYFWMCAPRAPQESSARVICTDTLAKFFFQMLHDHNRERSHARKILGGCGGRTSKNFSKHKNEFSYFWNMKKHVFNMSAHGNLRKNVAISLPMDPLLYQQKTTFLPHIHFRWRRIHFWM